MSRGARALTLYQGIWQGIIEARPDLNKIDWIEVWGRNPKHDWSRVDPAKIDLVSLMKILNWHPGPGDLSGSTSRRFAHDPSSESYWKSIIESISLDGLQRFAAHAITHAPVATMAGEDLTADEVALIATMAPVKQQASAQWGTW